MKTTVELPDELLEATRKYALERGTSFKRVLIEALNLLVHQGETASQRPRWEKLFGAFGDDDLLPVQEAVDREFSHVDPKEWS